MKISWKLVLRASVSVALLVVLVRRIEAPAILSRLDDAEWSWLAGALVLTLAGIVLSALRWRQVLTALGLPTRLRTLCAHHLAGLFVGNFLPSTIGGDVLRVSRLSAANGERPDTFASVVLERLTGWLVLPVLTLASMVVNPGLGRLGTASAVAFGLATGTLVLLAVVVVLLASPRLGGLVTGSAGWQRFAGAVHLGLDRLRHHPGAALTVLGAGVAYQLMVVMASILAARAIGLDVSITAALAFVPAVAIAQVLPISLGGLGVREGAFVLFLGPLGVPAASAVALGLLVYGLNLVVSLLGAPAFALGAGGPAPVQPVGATGA